MPERFPESFPERRLECGDCKKPIHYVYSEFVDKALVSVGMCDDCPFLREKLLGKAIAGATASCHIAKVQCGGCRLSLEEVKRGALLGCPLCYEVFEEELTAELVARGKIQSKHLPLKKGVSLHSGRRPGGEPEESSSAKLYALHQALSETLGREEYERAALLRDQIKELMKQQAQSQNQTQRSQSHHSQKQNQAQHENGDEEKA